jgi:ATP-binding cassette subfamily C protein
MAAFSSLGFRLPASSRSEISSAVSAFRPAFVGIGFASAVINILYLTGSFFMLEVYDRVIPGRSIPTLVGLLIIATMLFAFQCALDIVRGRLLARVGLGLDEKLSARVYDALLQIPLRGRSGGDGLQPLRDLDQVRAFLSSGGPTALFDLPWIPLYLAICFAFHFWIGVTATVGACFLIVLTILNEALSRGPSMEAAALGAHRNGLAESTRRNAEVIRAMGMAGAVSQAWGEINLNYMVKQRRAADVAGSLGSVSKVLRMLLQSIVLAVGAYLVIGQQATSGIMIASSILTARSLAPVEQVIGNWRGFLSARQSWTRLNELLQSFAVAGDPVRLPKPSSRLAVENISVTPPNQRAMVVRDITLSLDAGQALGVIGPSGSGKSSFVRALVGVWPTASGKVRLDGAALDQWHPEKLGAHIGYLPQDVELFEGTVAQNIARFDREANAEAIVEAAQIAGVHDLILRLPDGYETQIGESGAALSGGQRQRVALARALYNSPFLVVLDEPNSNLDPEGEGALTKAIGAVRQRGGIVVIVAHRPSALVGVDQVLILQEGGRMKAFGPKEEMLGKVVRAGPKAPVSPLAAVS